MCRTEKTRKKAVPKTMTEMPAVARRIGSALRKVGAGPELACRSELFASGGEVAVPALGDGGLEVAIALPEEVALDGGFLNGGHGVDL